MLRINYLMFIVKNILTRTIIYRYNQEKKGEIHMKLKRLQKMSSFLHVVLKILSVSSVVTAIIVFFMKLFNSKNIIMNKLESDTIFYFQTEFFAIPDNQQYIQTEQWILVGVAIFTCIFIAWLLWIASLIFKDLSTGFTPFSEIEINRLRKIAGLLLIYALAPQILYSVLHTILIPGYSFTFGLNMSFFFAIIFYCLTEIFRYGALLQKESDETL